MVGNPAVMTPSGDWVPLAACQPKAAVLDNGQLRWEPLSNQWTWGQVKAQYSTWEELLEAVPSWADINRLIAMNFLTASGNGWWPLYYPIPDLPASTVVLDALPNPMQLIAQQATGKVTSTVGAVTGGTVEIQAKVGETWTTLGSVELTIYDFGTYIVPFTPTGDLAGQRLFRTIYTPQAETDVQPGISAEHTITVGLQATTVYPMGLTNEVLDIRWDAVTGAGAYEIQDSTGRVWYSGNLREGFPLNYDWRYWFKVRPYIDQPDGSKYFGPDSNLVWFNTGHPEQRRSGSGDWTFTQALTGSFRDDSQGWQTGDIYQGWYGSSSRNYLGCCFFDGNGIRAWINAAYGEGVWQNLQTTGFWIHGLFHKSGVGRNASIPIHFRMINGWGGQGKPGFAGDEVRNSPAWNQWWDGIGMPADWARQLIQGAWTGWGMEDNGSANYAAFQPSDANSGRIQVQANWNFVVVNYQGPGWG